MLGVVKTAPHTNALGTRTLQGRSDLVKLLLSGTGLKGVVASIITVELFCDTNVKKLSLQMSDNYCDTKCHNSWALKISPKVVAQIERQLL